MAKSPVVINSKQGSTSQGGQFVMVHRYHRTTRYLYGLSYFDRNSRLPLIASYINAIECEISRYPIWIKRVGCILNLNARTRVMEGTEIYLPCPKSSFYFVHPVSTQNKSLIPIKLCTRKLFQAPPNRDIPRPAGLAPYN